jgi:hypothetical protein
MKKWVANLLDRYPPIEENVKVFDLGYYVYCGDEIFAYLCGTRNNL